MMICKRRGIPIPILNYLNYLRPLSHGNCRFRIRGWGRVLGTYMHINFLLHFTYIAFSNVPFHNDITSYLSIFLHIFHTSIFQHFHHFTIVLPFCPESLIHTRFWILDSTCTSTLTPKNTILFHRGRHLIDHAGHEGALFPWREARW